MSGLDKRCTWFNRRWLEFTGQPMEAEVGRGWADGVHPEDLKRCVGIYEAHFDRREPFAMDYRLRRADGEWRWIYDTGMPLVDERGHFLGYIGSCVDVHERRMVEEKLREELIRRQRREANHDLLNAVTDDFALLTSEDEITTSIGTRLAAHLDVSTCTVADFADGAATIRHAFASPGAFVATSTLKVSDYLNEELRSAARAGRTIVVRDTRTDPRVDAVRYDAMGVRAGIIVPLHRGSEWCHSFAVGAPEPRDWRDDEIQLVEEVAHRFFRRIERARAQEALRESEQRYMAIHDHAPYGIAVTDVADGTLVSVNETFLALFEYRREEVLGKTSVDLGISDPESQALVAEELLRYGRVRDLVCTRSSRSGKRLVLSLNIDLVAITGRRHAVTCIQDITERKRAESRAEDLARFPEENPDPVLRVSQNLALVYANPAAVRELKELGITLGQPAPAALAGPVETALRERCRLRTELSCGGSVFSVSVVPVGGDVNVYAQDITERKRAEEALRDADARKNEFLAVLSHELRNPLAPLRNASFLLERVPADSVQGSRARAVIRRQLDHLARLVEDLLDVTRISRGKLQLQREVLDLREPVRRTVDDHRPLFEEAGVELSLSVPESSVWVDVDPTRIAQAVGNLLSNARKFTPPRGTVRVQLRAHDGKAKLLVHDTGTGIQPSQLARMFEPFAQEARSLARTEGGLGLGLALSKGLVEAHGGAIVARSDGAEKGSDFIITLPIASNTPGVDERRAELHRSSVKRRVLLVDDNEDAARTLADVLELFGHEVWIAPDGGTGIERARELRPDVVICDVGLPDVSGYEVAKTLRRDEALRSIRLIALSGYGYPEDKRKAREAGFEMHLTRPVPLETLQQLLA
jgi:PAS domain S-box-containing protein